MDFIVFEIIKNNRRISLIDQSHFLQILFLLNNLKKLNRSNRRIYKFHSWQHHQIRNKRIKFFILLHQDLLNFLTRNQEINLILIHCSLDHERFIVFLDKFIGICGVLFEIVFFLVIT
jgi:hypothetical protein